MNKTIVNSLCSTDFYKISMLRAYFHRFPNMIAKFRFKCRNKDVIFKKKMVDEINKQLDHLCTLQFTKEEVDYIMNIRFMKGQLGFRELLRNFKLHRELIHCEYDANDPCGMKIYTDEDSILAVTMFEIYILQIVNEVYFYYQYKDGYGELLETGRNRLEVKVERLKKDPLRFSEFGLRRRFSYDFHDEVVGKLKTTPLFLGTSDVHMAMKHNVTASGTFAHEWVQAGQGLKDIANAYSQEYMYRQWLNEYEGDNGICLSDCLGYNQFRKDFNKLIAMSFTGTRHDSGDPIKYGEMMIDLYTNLGINPMSKTIVFSDGLNLDEAYRLRDYFNGRIGVGFGIGTYFTNDMGVKALNIVMKMVKCNGKDVAKLGASPIINGISKTMSDNEDYVNYLRKVTNWEPLV
jgi:nicotinate phosphoribosyltransferase